MSFLAVTEATSMIIFRTIEEPSRRYVPSASGGARSVSLYFSSPTPSGLPSVAASTAPPPRTPSWRLWAVAASPPWAFCLLGRARDMAPVFIAAHYDLIPPKHRQSRPSGRDSGRTHVRRTKRDAALVQPFNRPSPPRGPRPVPGPFASPSPVCRAGSRACAGCA